MARYDQCDETCTTDCGHCKGAGKPSLRAGQMVEVTFVAIYDGEPRDSRGWLLGLNEEAGFQFDVPRYATIEPVEDLRPGDVYRTAKGNAYMYVPATATDDMPWVGPCPDLGCRDLRHRDDCVSRPLTLLVRDGQVVQS